jgi:hypothetical protein
MSNIITRDITWASLYYKYTLEQFLQNIKHSTIKSTQIEIESEQTIVTFDTAYSSQDMNTSFTLVPDEVIIEKNKNISFNKLQTFNLVDFPQLLKFVETHCSYIFDFITDQKIENVTISTMKLARHADNFDTLFYKLDEFQRIKTLLETNCIELQPLVFAALIKNFYQQNSEPLTTRESSIFNQIYMCNEKINTLFNANIEMVVNYNINPYTDQCIKNGNTFEFLDNFILQTNNFHLYEQNLDLKFLSFISQQNLKYKI